SQLPVNQPRAVGAPLRRWFNFECAVCADEHDSGHHPSPAQSRFLLRTLLLLRRPTRKPVCTSVRLGSTCEVCGSHTRPPLRLGRDVPSNPKSHASTVPVGDPRLANSALSNA